MMIVVNAKNRKKKYIIKKIKNLSERKRGKEKNENSKPSSRAAAAAA